MQQAVSHLTDKERIALLSPTHHFILNRSLSGMSIKEIAHERKCHVSVIYKHKQRMFKRLGVLNDHQMILLAARAGLIEAEGR